MSEYTPTQTEPVSSSDPDRIREEIERSRANLSSDVNALADRVSPGNVARRQVDKVRDGVGGLKDKVMGSASGAGSSASDRLGSGASAAGDKLSAAGDAASSVPGRISGGTQGNPLAAGVIAFGVGMLVSSLLPASRAEQQLAEKAKENAAPLTESVKDAAKDAAENLKPAAQDAVQSVKQTATDASATVQDEGRSAASDVGQQAQEARDTVQNGQA